MALCPGPNEPPHFTRFPYGRNEFVFRCIGYGTISQRSSPRSAKQTQQRLRRRTDSMESVSEGAPRSLRRRGRNRRLAFSSAAEATQPGSHNSSHPNEDSRVLIYAPFCPLWRPIIRAATPAPGEPAALTARARALWRGERKYPLLKHFKIDFEKIELSKYKTQMTTIHGEIMKFKTV